MLVVVLVCGVCECALCVSRESPSENPIAIIIIIIIIIVILG